MSDIKVTFLNKKIWLVVFPKDYHITLYEYDLKQKDDKDEEGKECHITYLFYLDKKINKYIKIYSNKGKITHTKFDGKVIIEKR